MEEEACLLYLVLRHHRKYSKYHRHLVVEIEPHDTLCHRLTNILEMHRGPWQKTVEQRSLQLTPAVSRNSENHISFDIPYLFTICNEWRVSFFIYFRKSAATFAKCRYDFSYYLCIKFCNINFIEISWSLGNSYKICWKLTNFAKSGRGSQSSIKNSC